MYVYFCFNCSEAVWIYNENNLETLKQFVRGSHSEWQNLVEVHNFIEQHKLGVAVTDLMVSISKKKNVFEFFT